MNTKHGPFIITAVENKYTNTWIKVDEYKVIRPEGKQGIFGIVMMQPGISILALDNDNFVYLTKEFRFAIGKTSIEVVSGGIDAGETPEVAAKRELQEELNIVAQKLTPLGEINPFTSVINSSAHLFLASDLDITQIKTEEELELIKVPFSKAHEMVINGEITHGPSCVLILKAAEYLKSQKNKGAKY
jgi:8-oxo-dGTP pyrophosphatase MutT (NUDIX family)